MVNITIVYPADPLGVIPGGIDTCIRDIIRCAPDGFRYSLLGATTDPVARPVRRWSTCKLGEKSFDFFPLYAIDNPHVQPRIPATVRHMLPLLLSKPRHEFDVLQFHRIEQIVPYINVNVPKYVVIHQNMVVVNSRESDIRWKYAPGLYFRMEGWLIPKFSKIFCVHRKGVKRYKKSYAEMEERFEFLPTWMNPEVFFPASRVERNQTRKELLSRYAIEEDATILLSVGRIDKQKNPRRLVHALNRVVRKGINAHLLMVGDGALRAEVEGLVSELGLAARLTMAGVLPNDVVARYLRGSDLLVLASDYEGMPRCVIEALGCGIPVATTDVGEVRKVVKPGINGQIACGFSPEEYADAIQDCLTHVEEYRGDPCTDAVRQYTPAVVLAPVYQAIRELAEKGG